MYMRPHTTRPSSTPIAVTPHIANGEPVYMRPGPTPLTDLDSTGVGGHDQLGAEVGHPREHAPPVLPDLVTTVEDSAGTRWLLAAVPRREALDERIKVVRVHLEDGTTQERPREQAASSA
jgi:hypothetical protein